MSKHANHPKFVSFSARLCWRVVALLILSFVRTAHAQPMGKIVVVPLGIGDAHDAFATADALEARLTQRRMALVPMHDARDRFTLHSRPPLTASTSDLDVLAREARQAVEHVAFGRTSAAQRSVREVITRAERSLESLNRETARARQLLDACLALVRSQLHAEHRAEALEQAAACRRLVPDLAPSEVAHPPMVIGVLAEADDMLRRTRVGKLMVNSAPQQGCSVFLNGRHLGTTPFMLERAAPGEYRVQVECNGNATGRVHTVQLGEEPAQLTVDTTLDAAVRSEPRLFLDYHDDAALRAGAVHHATALGQQTHAEDMILVRVRQQRAELLRVHVPQGRLIARAVVSQELPEDEREAAFTVALAQLIEARIEGVPSIASPIEVPPPLGRDLRAPAEQTVVTNARLQQRFQEERSARQRRAGYALAGVSVALFTTGLALELRSQSVQADLVRTGAETSLADKRRHDRLARASWLGVASGPVGLGAALLDVRPRDPIPWWSYALAGGGAALLGASAYELGHADSCKLRGNDACLVKRDSTKRAAILLSAAVPLLSMPLLHWWKRTTKADLRVSAAHTAGGALVSGKLSF